MSTNDSHRPLGVALVGAGQVADRYAIQLRSQRSLQLVGVAARRFASARAFAARHRLKAYRSLTALLTDPQVELVVNLTPPRAHAEITARCLRAGMHVYSEKPLALDPATARRLVSLARKHHVRLGCAPATFLGDAHRETWRLLRTDRIGPVRVVYAEVNHGRIERFIARPEPFFAEGPLWDVAVYPLAALTAFFGSICSVQALGQFVLPSRRRKDGRIFRLVSPDFVTALLRICGGPLIRLTANYYVDRDRSKTGGSLEYHGDRGRIYTGDFQLSNALVEWAPEDASYRRVRQKPAVFQGVDFSLGVLEMIAALRADRPHRADGEHAAHLVEVVAALHRSIRGSGREIPVRSTFSPPLSSSG
jgi:predicted dehydrogenase